MTTAYGSITVSGLTDIADIYFEYSLAVSSANVTNDYPFTQAGELGWTVNGESRKTPPTWQSGYKIWVREVKIKTDVATKFYGNPYPDTAVNQTNIDLVALQTKVKKIWSNSTGSYMASGIGGNDVRENDVSTYGFNSKSTTTGVSFNYNAIPLTSLGTDGLKLYAPVVSNNTITSSQLGLELTNSALKFYRPGTATVDAQLTSSGLQITNGSIVLGSTSGTAAGNVTLSNTNFTRSINDTSRSGLRLAIGSKFGVDDSGTLYADGANITNINANNISTNLLSAIQAKVSTLSAITANMGTLTAGTISYGTTGSNDSFYLSADSSKTATIAGASRSSLRLTVGSGFGVDVNGKLYATGADITGAIKAQSLTIESNATINDSSGLIRNDAIEIGGTNMLGNTSNPSGTEIISNSIVDATFGDIGNYNDAVSSYSFEDFDGHSNSIKWTSTETGDRGVTWYTKVGAVKASTEYIFSCKVKSTVATTAHMHTGWRNGSATSGYTGWTSEGNVSIAANTWTDYSCTFKPNSTAKLDWEFLVALCFTGISSGATFYVAHAKLEKGNKATDWTPAPEDLETRVAATEDTIEGMPTKVSDFEDAENYTLKTTFNELNKYVNTHMILSNGELSILADDIPSRIKLGLEGLSIYGTNGIMAQYGEDAVIGNPASFHITITPNYNNTNKPRLSFYRDAEHEVAYISEDKLYITQSVVLQQMDVGRLISDGGGGQWSWKVHEVDGKNNLYLKWLG